MQINKLSKNKLVLGCGLIRIGRIWGVDSKPVPTEKEAINFLESAFEMGIRFFDTAPSYGLSEKRLGKFLKNLSQAQRKDVIVATKFGECWNEEKQKTYVDHSFEGLKISFENSIKLLGRIDLLQLHKSSPELLLDKEVDRAFQYAKKYGVNSLGVSVSDIETGLKTCEDARFSYIQLPYNQERQELLSVIKSANNKNTKILFNRPLAMGAVANKKNKKQAISDAYSFIKNTESSGFILSGTASTSHLQENITLFKKT